MSDNWVVSTLEDALSNWNNKLAEIWSLISQTPESFRGGEIWTVIVSIHNALVGFGYGLLVLFFAMGVFRSAASFRELQRPEFALRHFIRFLLAKVAVGSSLLIRDGRFGSAAVPGTMRAPEVVSSMIRRSASESIVSCSISALVTASSV